MKKESDSMKEFLKTCNEINKECDSTKTQLDMRFKSTMAVCTVAIVGIICLVIV